MHNRAPKLLNILLLGLVWLPFHALSNTPAPTTTQQQATARQPTPLRQQPSPDAVILTELNKAEPLQVLTRQGGWYQVAPSTKPEGWVRLFALQFTKTIYRPDNQLQSDINGLVTPGHNQVTSSTGVRGLDKVSIENAHPDFAALVLVQSFAQSKPVAQAFASEASLQVDPALRLSEGQP